MSWVFGDQPANAADPVMHFDNEYSRTARATFIATGGYRRPY
jgi:hypothetical protein